MNKVILFFSIFILIVSCNDNDDSQNDNLPRLVLIDNSSTETDYYDTYFEYNDNGFLNRVHNNYIETIFYYNSLNQVERLTHGVIGENVVQNYITNFNYENNKIVSSYWGDNQQDLTLYFYNDEGLLTSMMNYNDDTQFYNYNEEGNLIEISSDTFNNTTLFEEYDDKMNPFNFMFPEAFLKIVNHYDTFPFPKYNRNNIISEIHETNGTITYDEELTYEYNSFNLPVMVTSSESENSWNYIYE